MEHKQSQVREAKWINVVGVCYSLGGTRRHAYFHPQSNRLEDFKKNMKSKIIEVVDTRIEKGICWVN